jgi:4a-hydroxytetrahydrobiopterin dehydratase
MPELLNPEEISSQLKTLPGWSGNDRQIEKTFQLKDFKAALDLLNHIGDIAEEMDHHPDLFLHSWNKLKITISTHSAGGVTSNDASLARKIEEIAGK